jgi:hypothetical protein
MQKKLKTKDRRPGKRHSRWASGTGAWGPLGGGGGGGSSPVGAAWGQQPQSPAAALSKFNQRLWGCHLGCTST